MNKYFKNFLILFLLSINSSFGSDEIQHEAYNEEYFKNLIQKDKDLTNKCDDFEIRKSRLEQLIRNYKTSLNNFFDNNIITVLFDKSTISIITNNDNEIKDVHKNKIDKIHKKLMEIIKLGNLYIYYTRTTNHFYLSSVDPKLHVPLISSTKDFSYRFTKFDNLKKFFEYNQIFYGFNLTNTENDQLRNKVIHSLHNELKHGLKIENFSNEMKKNLKEKESELGEVEIEYEKIVIELKKIRQQRIKFRKEIEQIKEKEIENWIKESRLKNQKKLAEQENEKKSKLPQQKSLKPKPTSSGLKWGLGGVAVVLGIIAGSGVLFYIHKQNKKNKQIQSNDLRKKKT
jgi:hypothetical protein